jgi:hypothetical protein
MVKEGSKWVGTSSDDKFHIIHLVEIDGKTWVHYIKENAPEDSNREYSCYLESFLTRFRPLPE